MTTKNRFISFLFMKLLHQFIIFVSIGLLLSACEEERERFDIAPYHIQIELLNKKGYNLLDPNIKDNMLNSDFYLIYNDVKTDIIIGWNDNPTTIGPITRWFGGFIAPVFKEVYGTPENPDYNYIFIGEFKGNIENEPIFLNVEIDGKIYEIKCVNKLKDSRPFPEFYLDGKKQEGDIIKIII